MDSSSSLRPLCFGHEVDELRQLDLTCLVNVGLVNDQPPTAPSGVIGN